MNDDAYKIISFLLLSHTIVISYKVIAYLYKQEFKFHQKHPSIGCFFFEFTGPTGI